MKHTDKAKEHLTIAKNSIAEGNTMIGAIHLGLAAASLDAASNNIRNIPYLLDKGQTKIATDQIEEAINRL